MRLAVVGGRDFNNYEWMCEELDKLNIDAIVSGGAKGADSLAEKYAFQHDLPFTSHLAQSRAGFIRNKEIVKDCDAVIAFWDGQSKGTNHTINLARSQMKPCKIMFYEQKKDKSVKRKENEISLF